MAEPENDGPPADSAPLSRGRRGRALRELAAVFLRLGLTAFGGPAAHVAMMDDEIVRRRRWMSREDFLDHYGAANLIPGPTSTELVIHIGLRRAGWAGLLLAGSCFILPAALLTGAIAWAYTRYGALPGAAGLLYGVKPVIIAVVVQALVALARTALKTRLLVALSILGAAASLVGVNALAILLGAGALTAFARWSADRGARAAPPGAAAVAPWLGGLAVIGGAGPVPFGLPALFFFFLKIGAVLFGSGYVLLAFLRADLVERLHWLSEAQLLDAVAVGQLTPGPVFTTATFIGYLLGGAKGAAVATLGIFAPAFAYVALTRPLLPRLRRSRLAGAFLDGVNAASLALMAAVGLQLGRAAIVDLPTALLAAASALILLRFKPNSAWLVLGGGLVGLALAALR